MLYLILNGPPKVGKSHIARELAGQFTSLGFNVASDSFAAPMKHFISVALGAKYHEMPKDSPMAELGGHSIREFLIDLSENYMKPRYGQDVYGRLLAYRSLRNPVHPDIVLCDDSGFEAESDALGEGKTILVQVRRPGHTFKGDSRSYLDGWHFQINNNGSLAELDKQLRELVAELAPQIPKGV